MRGAKTMHPHSRQAHGPAHKHERKPADLSYRFVVRAVLWVIAAAVFVGFAVWWILT
jgi:hypothetical protein